MRLSRFADINLWLVLGVLAGKWVEGEDSLYMYKYKHKRDKSVTWQTRFNQSLHSTANFPLFAPAVPVPNPALYICIIESTIPIPRLGRDLGKGQGGIAGAENTNLIYGTAIYLA